MDHDRSDPDPSVAPAAEHGIGPHGRLGLRRVPLGPLDRLTARWGGRPLGETALAVAAVVAAVAVGWWFLRPAPAPVESALPAAPVAVAGPGAAPDRSPGPDGSGASVPPAGGAVTTTSTPELVVQAAGAVVGPGVYRLPAGARVDDLVRAAGGLAAGADADRVNLAAPLVDGERVWVPHDGEEAPPEVVAGGAAPPPGHGTAGAGTGPVPTGPVDLNRATAEELDTLPGVGPATAAAILAHREEHGRFGSVEELLEVRGIGDAKLEQLRPLVTV